MVKYLFDYLYIKYMCDLCFCRIWPSSGQPALHQRDDQHRTCQQGWKPAGRGHYSEGRVVYIPYLLFFAH